MFYPTFSTDGLQIKIWSTKSLLEDGSGSEASGDEAEGPSPAGNGANGEAAIAAKDLMASRMAGPKVRTHFHMSCIEKETYTMDMVWQRCHGVRYTFSGWDRLNDRVLTI